MAPAFQAMLGLTRQGPLLSLPHSFLDIAEEIAEQEGVPIEFEPIPLAEQQRMRHKTCADLTNLKTTIGKRKWLNVFEFLNQ